MNKSSVWYNPRHGGKIIILTSPDIDFGSDRWNMEVVDGFEAETVLPTYGWVRLGEL